MKSKSINYPARKSIVSLSLLLALSSSAVHAQLSIENNEAYGEKQKLSVQLQIRPTNKNFKAGILPMDSAASKLKIWVCNGEEKKWNISISNDFGIVWSSDFREVYYSQVYDFSALEDGTYKIHISSGKNRFEKTITIRSNTYYVKGVRVE